MLNTALTTALTALESGDFALARKHLEDALSEPTEDLGLALQVRMLLSDLRAQAGDFEPAIELLCAPPPAGFSEEDWHLIGLGCQLRATRLMFFFGQLNRADAMLVTLEEKAEEAPAIAVAASLERARIELIGRRAEAAVARANNAFERAHELGLADIGAAAAHLLGSALQLSGSTEEAADAFEAGLKALDALDVLSEEALQHSMVDVPGLEVELCTDLGLLYVELGYTDRVRDLGARLEARRPEESVAHRAFLFALAAVESEDDNADAALEEAISLAQEHSLVAFVAQLQLARAKVVKTLPERIDALESAAEWIQPDSPKGVSLGLLRARANLGGGRLEKAAAILATLENLDLPLEARADRLRLNAQVALAREDAGTAIASMEEVLALDEELADDAAKGRDHLLLAGVHRRTGNDNMARFHLVKARTNLASSERVAVLIESIWQRLVAKDDGADLLERLRNVDLSEVSRGELIGFALAWAALERQQEAIEKSPSLLRAALEVCEEDGLENRALAALLALEGLSETLTEGERARLDALLKAKAIEPFDVLAQPSDL